MTTGLLAKAHRASALLQVFGPGWLAFRAGYALQMRAGLLRRRLPAHAWSDEPLDRFLSDRSLADSEAHLAYRQQAAPRFFFAPGDRERYRPLLERWDSETPRPREEADEVLSGTLRYFRRTAVRAGYPPDWHANPLTGERAPAGRHWTEIGDFGHGDIKTIWEASRFGFVYPLVRAYWRTGDQRYAEAFWTLVESWRAANPPQLGPNWKCGQETSIRVMAWCFGLYGFLDAPATTAARRVGASPSTLTATSATLSVFFPRGSSSARPKRPFRSRPRCICVDNLYGLPG